MAEANLSLRTNSCMWIWVSLGLGSKVSMWLGPPSMVRKMHAWLSPDDAAAWLPDLPHAPCLPREAPTERRSQAMLRCDKESRDGLDQPLTAGQVAVQGSRNWRTCRRGQSLAGISHQ